MRCCLCLSTLLLQMISEAVTQRRVLCVNQCLVRVRVRLLTSLAACQENADTAPERKAGSWISLADYTVALLRQRPRSAQDRPQFPSLLTPTPREERPALASMALAITRSPDQESRA